MLATAVLAHIVVPAVLAHIVVPACLAASLLFITFTIQLYTYMNTHMYATIIIHIMYATIIIRIMASIYNDSFLIGLCVSTVQYKIRNYRKTRSSKASLLDYATDLFLKTCGLWNIIFWYAYVSLTPSPSYINTFVY